MTLNNSLVFMVVGIFVIVVAIVQIIAIPYVLLPH
jgi:hypothetical protein